MGRPHRAVPLENPAPGSYYGLACAKCKTFLPLYASKSSVVPVNFDGGQQLEVTCPVCGHDARYDSSALVRANLPTDIQ